MKRSPAVARAVVLAAAPAVLGLVAALASVAPAADEPKPEAPAVRVVAPLAVAAGEKVTLRLRGVRIGEATAVRLAGPAVEGLTLELKNKGNADGDDALKKVAGDTQVEVELTVPATPPPGEQLELVVVTPAGDTPPTAVRLSPADQLVIEAEPNAGFRQSQAVAADRCTIRGDIGGEKDVDVFRITGKAGQSFRAEVVAAAKGSLLDAALTLYDARGTVLAAADDAPAATPPPATPATGAATTTSAPTTAGSRDPLIEFKLPADGDYHLVVTDANDRGGAATHPYLVHVSKS